MSCNLCESGQVWVHLCECQYEKVDPMLRAKLLAECGAKGWLDPTKYDDDESNWEYTEIDGQAFDINIWFEFEEDEFNVTAYFTTVNQDGETVTDYEKYFRIFKKYYEADGRKLADHLKNAYSHEV